MQTGSSDSALPEPVPENLGKSSVPNAEVLGQFAESMAENIIHSLRELDPEVPSVNQNLEVLAGELASAVIEVATREVCVLQSFNNQPGGSKSSTSAQLKTDGEEADMVSLEDKPGEEDDSLDTRIDPNRGAQISRDTQSYHPPLSQSGLPVVGSLDYPDAPPTTPLLPELERSRSSFARKLKGGLAKVFLPSPPPPTPKDKKDNLDITVSDPQVELIEHLMHSLSPSGLGKDDSEARSLHGASLEAFAEDLSSEIMKRVLNVDNEEQISDESDLHLLAHQLAETIITSSLDKAKILV